MATNKKTKSLYYIIGAAIVGVGGYFAYNKFFKKENETPTPEPTPTPTPTPQPKPVKTTTAATPTQIAEMQNLMIKRFEQLGRANEYNAAAAKGGWGKKSRDAIAILMPTNARILGDPTAANIDVYLRALRSDVAVKAAQIKFQETAQKTTAENKKLAAAIVAHNKKGGTVKVLTEFKAPKVIFDTVKNTYIPADGFMRFVQGEKIGKDKLFDRGNGQILYKAGDVRYIINPNYLISQ